MLLTYRVAWISNVQFQQVRLGHRLRGKAPVFCRTIKERLNELNYKDQYYLKKIDIGFPRPRILDKVRQNRTEHVKKLKSDQKLEYLARSHQLQIDLIDVKNEWLSTLGPYHKKRIADHYAIFEHLYNEGYFIPYLNLDILYDLKKNDEMLPVYFGNSIKPVEALESPTVTFESDGNTLWTLVMTNLDGHLIENDKEYVHWFVANIPGTCVEKGETLVEYLQPFPLKGTGHHRYVFVLYKQSQRVSYDVHKVTLASPLADRTFITRDWYKKYQDIVTPIGLAFFQSDWDHTVKDFFHNLNMKEPIYEYDFPAPYIRPQEWFPHKKPFNLYMDKYRDPKQINKEYLLSKLKKDNPFEMPAPPLKFPNAHRLPHSMPSWLKLHERKIRLNWARVNDV